MFRLTAAEDVVLVDYASGGGFRECLCRVVRMINALDSRACVRLCIERVANSKAENCHPILQILGVERLTACLVRRCHDHRIVDG